MRRLLFATAFLVGICATVMLGQSTRAFLTNTVPSSYQRVRDLDLSMSGSTTNNATTNRHGFLPTLSNEAGEFLNGLGQWVVPAGTAGTVTNTGTLTAGKAIIGNGGVNIIVSSATGVAHLLAGTLTGANVNLASGTWVLYRECGTP